MHDLGMPLWFRRDMLSSQPRSSLKQLSLVAATLWLAVARSLGAPIILMEPSAQAYYPGDYLSIGVRATGSGTLAFQWSKDGAVLPGATDQLLQIFKVQQTDAGTYTVNVTDPTGTTGSRAAVITVLPPLAPSISSTLGDVATQQGRSFMLYTAASGRPAPTYQWRKDGVVIPNERSDTLMRPFAALTDAGEYSVTATNSAGVFTTQVANVSVRPAPAPVITVHPQSASILAGANSTALSISFDFLPGSEVQWFRNGSPLGEAYAVYLGYASYTIEGADATDAGTYHAVVSSPAGSSTSAGGAITVDGASNRPVITSTPGGLQAMGGALVQLQVEVSLEAGSYTVGWKKDGVVVAGANSLLLKLVDFSREQTGTYVAEVTTAKGIFRSAAIPVQISQAGIAPWIASHPKSWTAYPGTSASFLVGCYGEGPFTFQWRKNGVVIPGATDFHYDIASADATDAGDYTVVVSSRAGTITSQVAKLALRDPADVGVPVLSYHPTTQKLFASDNGFQLSVGVLNTSRQQSYQWFRDGLPIVGATRQHYAYEGALTAAVIGRYHVVVTNAAGSTVSESAQIDVAGSPGQIPTFLTEPPNITVEAGYGVSFGVMVTGLPTPRLQWFQNGAAIRDATEEVLRVSEMEPSKTGIYTATATNQAGSTESTPAIVGLITEAKVIGAGRELALNILHPNGRRFDQVQLFGAAESFTADAALGRMPRSSFIDLDGDIVQVEFAGAGTLSLVLQAATEPAEAAKYHQPGVQYVRGHAGIVIDGADETTNLTIFTVGRATAFDSTGRYDISKPVGPSNDPAQNGSPLFTGHEAAEYDGVADIAFIAVHSRNGRFGGIRTANANYFSRQGITGIYAPGVEFTAPVYVGNISAFESATPTLTLGSAADVRITGGDMLQPNGAPVRVAGISQLRFVEGADSWGRTLPAQTNRATFTQSGVDVTSHIVRNP